MEEYCQECFLSLPFEVSSYFRLLFRPFRSLAVTSFLAGDTFLLFAHIVLYFTSSLACWCVYFGKLVSQ